MANRCGTLNIFYNVLILIVFICCIKVNKASYLTLDGISITFNFNGSFDAVVVSYTWISLFVLKSNREVLGFGCRKKSFLNFVVIIMWWYWMMPRTKHYSFLETERHKVCTSKHLWITKPNSSVGNLSFRYLVKNWYYQFVREAYQWLHR